MPHPRAVFPPPASVWPLPRGKMLPALVAILLAALAPARAQVIAAVASGDWSDGATWAGGVVPGAANTATLSAVTLSLGSNATVGALSGAFGSGVALASGATLTTGGNHSSTTFFGTLSGAGALTKAGTGTFTLTGVNTFTGSATIASGTLMLSGGSALSDVAAVNLIGATAVLRIAAHETIGSLASVTGSTVTLANGATLTTGGNNSSTILAGILSGDGGLTKAGTGTLTLTGANTYTGGTTISAGTLAISGGAALPDPGVVGAGRVILSGSGATLVVNNSETIGSLSGVAGSTIALADGAALTMGELSFDDTFAGSIIGTLDNGITINGGGALTLSGENTYTGGTNLNAGMLVLGSAGALGTTGMIVMGGGTLQFTTTNTTDYSGRFSTAAGQAYNIDTNGQSVTFATALTSAGGSLTKLGAGTLVLTGANTYTGGTVLTEGTLVIATSSGIGTGMLTTSIGTALDTIVPGLTLTNDIAMTRGSFRFVGSQSLTLSGPITMTDGISTGGSGPTAFFITVTASTLTLNGNLGDDGVAVELNQDGANGTLVLGGANTYTGGTVLIGGTLSVGSAGALGSTGTISFNGGTLQFTAGNTTDYSGRFSAANNQSFRFDTNGQNVTLGSALTSAGGTLIKLGAGTLTLAGANTYTGTTTVSAGTLALSGGAALNDSTTVTLSGATAALLVNTSETIGELAGVAGSTVALGNGVVLTVGAKNTFSTFAGSIAGDDGASGLTKIGTNTLTLSGANTYTGPTIISGGTLALSGGAALADTGALNLSNSTARVRLITSETIGSLTGVSGSTITLSVGAKLTVGGDNTNTSFSGSIRGGNSTSGLIKIGTGTLTLSGGNTFTGTTTISAGTLVIDGSAVIANTGAVVLAASGATLSVLGGEAIGSLAGVAGSIVTLDSSLTTGLNNTSTTFSGNISGPGKRLTKTGTGTLTLNGINTYTDNTELGGGTLVLDGGQALSDLSPVFFSASSATLVLNSSETISSLSDSVGGSIVLNNGATLTINQRGAEFADTNISGAGGSLVKSGTQSLTLGGNSTFTGGVTIGSGTLIVNSATALGSAGTITFGGGVLKFGASGVDYSDRFSRSTNTPYVLGAFSTTTVPLASDFGSPGSTLTAWGPGTLALGGNNDFSGGITLLGATLSLDSAGALGSTGTITAYNTASGTGVLRFSAANTTDYSGRLGTSTNSLGIDTNGQTVTFASTLNYALGEFIKLGAGTLVLSGNNTFGASGISLNGGILALHSAGALGSSGIVFNGGTVQFSANNTTDYSSRFGAISGQAVSIDTNGQNVTFASVMSSPGGGVTKLGAGTLTLSAANIYTGPTKIYSGTLSVRFLANGDNIASGVGATTSAAANLVLDGGVLKYTGAATSTDRLFTLGLAGGTLDASGSGTLTFSNPGSVSLSGVNTARPFTLSGTGGGVLTPSLGDNSTGATSLAKTGTGTWTLSGANTYTGTTTVSAGTLALAGASSNNIAASATISVNAGARLNVTGLSQGTLVLANNQTLAGSGTVTGKITATTGLAHVSPGGSGVVGTLTVGSLVLSDHLALDFDFASLTTYDTLNVTALDGLSLLGGRFNLLNAGTATPFTGLGTFDLITFAGSLQDPTDILATLTASSILNAAAGLTYAFSVTGGDTLALTIDTRHHQWQVEHFGSTAALAAQPAADPEHDGLPNLLEYALGTDPLAASTASLPVAAATVSPADSLPHLTLTATLAAAAGDVSVDAEVSDDLVNWHAGTPFTEVVSDTTTGAVRTLVLRDVTPLGAGTKRFIRLRVSLP